MWWEILKYAKLSGKAKGKSFDASKIKINLDKNDCREELLKILYGAIESHQVGVRFIHTDFIKNELSEERACEFVKTLKYKLPYGLPEKIAERIKVGNERYDAIILKNAFVGYTPLKDSVVFKLMGDSSKKDWEYFAQFVFRSREEYAKWVKSI